MNMYVLVKFKYSVHQIFACITILLHFIVIDQEQLSGVNY